MSDNELDWPAIEETELAIAKAIGYEAVRDDDGSWNISTPDGELMYCENHDTEEGAWHSAIIHYGPEWARHTDSALELIDLVPGAFVLQSPAPDIWQAWFGTPGTPQALERTPALAICKAWLKAWNGRSK